MPAEILIKSKYSAETCAQRGDAACTLRVLVLCQLILVAAVPTWLRAQPNVPGSFPTGLRPQGLAVSGGAIGSGELAGVAAVANSGDNSVSIFRLRLVASQLRLEPLTTVTGIPAPHGITFCGDGGVLVTSPENNSVRYLRASDWQIVATFTTGLKPYHARCLRDPLQQWNYAYVSNWGESSLTIINMDTLQIERRIEGVPGARSFHGIEINSNALGSTYIAVAGRDANLVTQMNYLGGIHRQVPVSNPLSVTIIRNIGSMIILGQEGTTLVSTNVGPVSSNTPLERREVYRNIPPVREVFGGFAAYEDSLQRLADSVVVTVPEATAIGSVQITSSTDPGTTPSFAHLITSASTNRIYVVYSQGTPPRVVGFPVQSAASPQGVAPGGLASTYFASTGVAQGQPATTLPLPTTLAGLSLSFGGEWKFDWLTNQWSYSSENATRAPLLYAGPTQINFQIPPQTAPGVRLAEIRRPDGTSLIGSIDVSAAAPAIFTVAQTGQGQAVALNENNTLNSLSNPAPRGSVLQLYLTGAGATVPPIAAGEPANVLGNPLHQTVATPTVTISGLPARVLFSGLAPGFVGLWQINVEIPQSTPTGPPVPLRVSAGGVQSNLVTIAVQ